MKRKRAQIFLLLTILIITFIVGISSSLLGVQRARFADPAAKSDEFLITWDDTLSSVEDILTYALAARSDGTIVNTSIAMTNLINSQFVILQNYLLARGYSAVIQLQGNIVDGVTYLHHSNGAGPTRTYEGFELTGVEVNIVLKTSSISLEQKVFFDMLFYAQVNSVASTVTLYKLVNGERSGLLEAEFTGAGVTFTEQFNGRYSYTGTGTISARSLDGVLFSNLNV